MASSKDGSQFEREVFPAELQEIARRRAELARRDDAEPGGPEPATRPSPALGLVGLALSGGGIRSATFALGVIQALAARGVLKSVDYLSTVSGGGYIGSCLSSVLNTEDAGPEGARFPLRSEPGKLEPEALTHLRNSGNYLAPGGFLDRIYIPTLLLRGIVVNLLLVLPVVVIAVLLTELVYEYAYQYRLEVNIFAEGSRLLAVFFFLLFLIFCVTFPLTARLGRKRLELARRNMYERLFARCLLFSFLSVVLLLIFMVVREAVDHSWADILEEFQPRRSPQLRNYWIWLAAILFVGLFMVVGKASEKIAFWQGKVVIGAIGVIAPAFLFVLYLALCVWQISSPIVSTKLNFSLDATILSDPEGGGTLDDVRAEFDRKGHELSRDAQVAKQFANGTMLTDGGAAYFLMDTGSVYVKDLSDLPGDFETAKSKYTIGVKDDRLRIEPFRADLFDDGGAELYGLGILLVLFNWLFVNVNITSAHGFYRDRLSKAYLFQSDIEGGLRGNDQQRLSELNRDHTTAPYHLINVALNLQGSRDRNLRGRNADLFIFSKRFTGSPRTGFINTADLEKLDPYLNLGTALAISGAAAAPNMGTATVKPVVSLLTLLNIRLGYWLPNPAVARGASWLRRQILRRGAGPMHLWREARGKLDAKGDLVNVSDGGHIENLGIYELLRRRCKFIIAVDAEADPNIRFGGLLNLIRFARIDMGITIDIDLEPVRRGERGFNLQHGAVGTIDYGDGEVGHLMYIKSSMTGDEDYVRDYHARSPSYPHESTTDQFFSETQFEVYRWLGFHAAGKMLAGEEGIDIGVFAPLLAGNDR
jgi:hypothetical protein